MKDINISNLKNKKTAIVCSGGVVKAAAWHLGMCLALEELGYNFLSNTNSQNTEFISEYLIDTYVGSSAGAMVCSYLAAGYTPRDIVNSTLNLSTKKLKPMSYKDMFHLNKRFYKRDKKIKTSIFSDLPKSIRKIINPLSNMSGPFSTHGVKKYLENYVLQENKFEDLAADLFIVATQLDHSSKSIFSKYNYANPTHDPTSKYHTGISISDAAAASMSVPPFYSPYPIKSPETGDINYYIDGEIRETLSTHIAEDHGCEVIISSWTHTPYHYQDEIGSLVNYGLTAIGLQSIYLLIQKKIIKDRAHRLQSIDVIDTVNEYLKNQNMADDKRKKLTNILERKLHIKRDVRLIDIYPDANDYKLFFANAFTLNPKITEYIVQRGYIKTLKVFNNEY